MKQYFFIRIVLALMWVLPAAAQSVDNQVLNSAGMSARSGAIFLESNFGDPFVDEGSSPGFLLLTQGFLQPSGGIAAQPPAPLAFPTTSLPYGIDNGGESRLAGQLLLESTIGEWMTTARKGGASLLTQGILQPYSSINNNPLPVTGLQFFARRLNAREVELEWSTVQEIDNRGFGIERKRENDNSFTQLRFVASQASGGNSSTPLHYWQLDTNAYAGKTWYRLRQIDIDEHSVYSVVRQVNGRNEQAVALKAWPIPAREFQVQMTGTPYDQLLIFSAVGARVRRIPVKEGVPVTVSGLLPGLYVLGLQSQPELTQKITVQ